jgi:hypothetical protein
MPILSTGVIVVEAYIGGHSNTEATYPSIQCSIDPLGNTKIADLTAQMVDSQGQYIGTLISPDIFTQLLSEKLYNIGHTIGEMISELGYRGIFNIDTILSEEGTVYCLELNARRTSAKYVLDLATWLLGPSLAKKVTIITNERFSSKHLVGCTYSDIYSRLSSLLFPINGKIQGVIITIVSSLSHFTRTPRLGFVVIGENLNEARSIFTEVCQLLNTDCSRDVSEVTFV